MARREIDKERVPAIARQTHLLHIVVEDLLWDAAKELESLLVSANQGGQIHGGGEAHETHARIAQHHDEGIDADLPPAAIREAPAVSPVGLSLLSRRGFKAHRCFRRRRDLGFQRLQETTHNNDRTAEALGLYLLKNARGREPRIAITSRDIVLECIELGGALWSLERRGSLLPQHMADRVAGETGRPGDLANGVALLVEEFDVHELIWIEHLPERRSLAGEEDAIDLYRDRRTH